MNPAYSLREIAARFGGELLGDGDVRISRISSLASAQRGDLSFLADSKYRSLLDKTDASALLLSPQERDLTSLPRIVTDNPYAYFARVSALLNPPATTQVGVDASAVVDASSTLPASVSIGANAVIGRDVKLGENVVIGPGCIIGDGVAIGAGSWLYANVTIYHGCVMGKNCLLHAGTVIGADGFGYAEDNGTWVKIPQIGRVIIGDDVEIGANTTVDRGALDDTVIEDGVKLDNLIMVAHNCHIGAHTVIAGCTGIAGSAKIGRHCKIGGAAMIHGHLEIADGVTVSGGTFISRSVHAKDVYTSVMPFMPHHNWLKNASQLRHLDKLSERIKQLETELAKLKVTELKGKTQ